MPRRRGDHHPALTWLPAVPDADLRRELQSRHSAAILITIDDDETGARAMRRYHVTRSGDMALCVWGLWQADNELRAEQAQMQSDETDPEHCLDDDDEEDDEEDDEDVA